MSKKNQMGLWIFGLPFVVSAAIEFLPVWVYCPIALLGGMMWLGSCITLTELTRREE